MGSFAQLWWPVNCLLFFYCCWMFGWSFGRSAGGKVACRPLIRSFILIDLMCSSWAGITDVEPWGVALDVCKKMVHKTLRFAFKVSCYYSVLKTCIEMSHFASWAETSVSNDSDWSELGAIVSDRLEGIPSPTKRRPSAPVITEVIAKWQSGGAVWVFAQVRVAAGAACVIAVLSCCRQVEQPRSGSLCQATRTSRFGPVYKTMKTERFVPFLYMRAGPGVQLWSFRHS